MSQSEIPGLNNINSNQSLIKNLLIEEIFSIKAFKLYILDKFGNGKQDIFFKKVKNGEINQNRN